jgi:hypothetical protein
MNFRQTIRLNLRALALASGLALAIVGAPVFQGVALAADDCNLECGHGICTYNGLTYSGGELITLRRINGQLVTLMCNGNTGTWVPWRTATETGPVAPKPTTASNTP